MASSHGTEDHDTLRTSYPHPPIGSSKNPYSWRCLGKASKRCQLSSGLCHKQAGNRSVPKCARAKSKPLLSCSMSKAGDGLKVWNTQDNHIWTYIKSHQDTGDIRLKTQEPNESTAEPLDIPGSHGDDRADQVGQTEEFDCAWDSLTVWLVANARSEHSEHSEHLAPWLGIENLPNCTLGVCAR